MINEVIEIELSEKGIDHAILQLELFKEKFNAQLEEYRGALAELGKSKADEIISSSYANSWNTYGEYFQVPFNVPTSIEKGDENTTYLKASGDIVWVEFGSGVYSNGQAGSSPNPAGMRLGYLIGSYGQGKGKRQAWGYYDENGDLRITHGIKATMPLYNAMSHIKDNYYQKALEIFK